MTLVTTRQLTQDIQAKAGLLTDRAGLVPQSADQPMDAGDLLFYLSGTSMPMAAFLRAHGLFADGDGLHFDPAQFAEIRETAETVIREYEAGNRQGAWKRFDLSEDEDAAGNGTYLLIVLAALDLLYRHAP